VATSAAQTAATQWLERTLDDSVNRGLTLPQAFLATDGILRLALNVAGGLVVNPAVIDRAVAAELPFMATENLLMAAAAAGRSRQEAHERIRRHSRAVAGALKAGGDNDLLERLRADPLFAGVDFGDALDPARFVGRAPQQASPALKAPLGRPALPQPGRHEVGVHVLPRRQRLPAAAAARTGRRPPRPGGGLPCPPPQRPSPGRPARGGPARRRTRRGCISDSAPRSRPGQEQRQPAARGQHRLRRVFVQRRAQLRLQQRPRCYVACYVGSQLQPGPSRVTTGCKG
jgi:hypothetical protein